MQLETVLRRIRLKSSEPTFFGTVFVRQKTCVTKVCFRHVSHLSCRDELMTLYGLNVPSGNHYFHSHIAQRLRAFVFLSHHRAYGFALIK